LELAGLLTHFSFDAFPSIPESNRIYLDSGEVSKALKKLTAAGTAPELHRIPY
jgi:hypothetical protein